MQVQSEGESCVWKVQSGGGSCVICAGAVWGRVPGLDRLPAELYNAVWHLIGRDLHSQLQESRGDPVA